MNEDDFDNVVEINQEAWEAAEKVAKAARKGYQTQAWSHLSWCEIRRQLHLNGDSVDTLDVPANWTGESLQMIDMQTILEEAGFEQDGTLYYWHS